MVNIKPITKNPETREQAARVSTLLEGLRKKVKNFVVFDSQGQSVGKIQNLILDAERQLNLVVIKYANNHHENHSIENCGQFVASNCLLLPSKLINKIDTPNQSVFMGLNKSQIENMPEYLGNEAALDEIISANTNTQATNYIPDNFHDQHVEVENLEQVVEEEIIRLLGERLIVKSTKHKIGEVIVRKQIETRMIQVPVRFEKLIVEQINPEHKQIAEINLTQEEISSVDLTPEAGLENVSFENALTVSGNFDSPKIASLLLNAIALERENGCKQVRVTIAVEDEAHQKKYREWFDRCSKNESPNTEG
jgi:stress response protein YsnF/sporulation protein YlmC with PRC-barrel domain